jgi:hypothetical protein
VQQAVAARDAAIAVSIASRLAPVKRPVGRPKVLAPLGVQAPPGERHVWAQLQLRWSGGEHQVRLHLHLEISETTTEEDEGDFSWQHTIPVVSTFSAIGLGHSCQGQHRAC